MRDIIFQVAASVILRADAHHAADGVLRNELKTSKLAPEQNRKITSLVFSYYRWFGWLDANESLLQQLRLCQKLNEDWIRNQAQFSDEDILRKAAPPWIWEQVPQSIEYARTLQREPKLWLRARAGQGTAVAAELGNCERPFPELLPDTLEYRGQNDLFRTRAFLDGLFEIQDLTSQWVGIVCDPSPGETWWDACAGEGGKLLHLSSLMGNKGLIWASDRAGWRLKRLKRRTARAQAFNYRSILWDGGPKLPTKTQFNGVLVDAPCTGVGTWQRNPHARWTTTAKDVTELAELQKRLLAHAAKGVKAGGKLVYSVCTLTRAETEEVAADFEAKHPAFSRVEIARPSGEKENGRCWLWPQDWSGNGMFIAAWKRTELQRP
jgi:16S rRNA (cytosine967-C5)-methyltransferase